MADQKKKKENLKVYVQKPAAGPKPLVCVAGLSCERDCLLIEAGAPSVTQPGRCRIETQESGAQSVLSADDDDDEPQGRPDEEVFIC